MLRMLRTGVFWREQSGQRMPTGVAVMQSGQIGLPQFEQRTPVSTFGWLAHVTGGDTPGSALDTAASVPSAPGMQRSGRPAEP